MNKEEQEKAYQEAVLLWRLGEHTAQQISEKVGLPQSKFAPRFRKEGETKGSDKKEVQTIARAEVKDFKEEQMEEYSRMASDIMTKSLKGVQLVQDTRLRLIITTLKEKKKLHVIYGELKALVEAGKGMKNDWDLVKDILGLNHEDEEEGDVPELVYREMTVEDIERVRAEQKAQYEEEMRDPNVIGGS